MSRAPRHAYANLLEPAAWLRLFCDHPPAGFSCGTDASGQPVFVTAFDILTTMEGETLRMLRKLPLFSLWSKLFTFRTRFLGSTNTEYAPLAAGPDAAAMLRGILAGHAGKEPLCIIKDLPDNSPLLPEEDNALAEALAAEASRQRFIAVQGQALAYVPLAFSGIEEYLSGLSAARRKDLRRKLKRRDALDVRIVALGDPLFRDRAFCDELYSLYLAVYEQSEIHFDLLSRDYMDAVLRSDAVEGVVILYRRKSADGRAGELVGHNICLVCGDKLLDKYIGLKYPDARELNLYFVSWMVNLEYALQKGLRWYVAGWTDPEVKKSLGASFTFTRHLVWVRNPLLRRVLYRFRRLFESDRRALEDRR